MGLVTDLMRERVGHIYERVKARIGHIYPLELREAYGGRKSKAKG